MGSGASPDILEKRKFSYSCQESTQDPTVIIILNVQWKKKISILNSFPFFLV